MHRFSTGSVNSPPVPRPANGGGHAEQVDLAIEGGHVAPANLRTQRPAHGGGRDERIHPPEEVVPRLGICPPRRRLADPTAMGMAAASTCFAIRTTDPHVRPSTMRGREACPHQHAPPSGMAAGSSAAVGDRRAGDGELACPSERGRTHTGGAALVRRRTRLRGVVRTSEVALWKRSTSEARRRRAHLLWCVGNRAAAVGEGEEEEASADPNRPNTLL